MEPFLEQLAEKITEQRMRFAAEGLTGDALTERTAEWFNATMESYYEKLMEAMSSEDYNQYKKALHQEDAELLKTVMAKYEGVLADIRKEIIDGCEVVHS